MIALPVCIAPGFSSCLRHYSYSADPGSSSEITFVRGLGRTHTVSQRARAEQGFSSQNCEHKNLYRSRVGDRVDTRLENTIAEE